MHTRQQANTHTHKNKQTLLNPTMLHAKGVYDLVASGSKQLKLNDSESKLEALRHDEEIFRAIVPGECPINMKTFARPDTLCQKLRARSYTHNVSCES
jgi:hypothetical protein